MSNDDAHYQSMPGDGDAQPWEQMLRQFLGEAAEPMIEQIRASGVNPMEMMPPGMAATMPSSPAELNAFAHQYQMMMNSSSGPVNWTLAESLARSGAWTASDTPVSAATGVQLRQALTTADLWLDTVTTLDPARGTRHVWRRSDWVDGTIDAWKTIVEPVANAISKELTDAVESSLAAADDPMIAGIADAISSRSLFSQLAAQLVGAQVGNALSKMAQSALGLSDAGMPMTSSQDTALVAVNVDAFAEGFDIPLDEVRQFVAVREAARARLFASVGWLRTRILEIISNYCEHTKVSVVGLERMMDQAGLDDPTQIESVSHALGIHIDHGASDAQDEAIDALQTLFALIEGWVEVVTVEAARPFLPHVEELNEILRRRRIADNPIDTMLRELIGVGLQPGNIAEATRLWRTIMRDHDLATRDAQWTHPDLAPTREDLDDPEGFSQRRARRAESEAHIDAALESLLDGTLGWASGLEPGQDSEGDATTHK